MNVSTFLQNFRSVANAPDGVQRLRELVLQLAATGRLVPRVKSEGDSESLIAAVSDERDRLANSGEVRLATSLPDVDSGSQLSSVPSHWCWIRLGNLTSKIGSGSTPRGGSKVYVTEGVPFLRSQNIWNDGVRLDDVVFISAETHAKMRNTHVLPNDILLNITGASLGRCAKVPSNFATANVSQHVTIIRPLLAETRHFLHICLLSPFGQAMIWGRQVGMAREGLSKKVLEQFEIPMPPLEEQKRIVAKVDELMRLCDRLEAQQQERENLLPLLSRANHARFVAKPTPTNLRAVFSAQRLSSPAHLKDSVLSLAVKGLIVRQDESDQPADELLRDILSHIQGTNERRASKRAKKVQSVESSSFPLPLTWKWVRLGAISESIEYGISHKADSLARNIPVYRMGDIQNGELRNDNLKYVPREIDDLPGLFLQPGDILFNRTNSTELVGKAAIFRGPPDTHTFASYLIRVRLPKEFVNPEYINLCFLSPYFRATQIAPELTQQCGQANFNGTKLANTLFPLPPKSEQVRIVLKVKELMEIVTRLETMQAKAKQVANDFAVTTIALFTGMSNTETKQMKPPKTEVVSALKVGSKPKTPDAAPLATLLSKKKAEASAKVLWQLSGLEIDAFYRQLKTEMANGWITEPEKASVKEVEVS